MLKVKFKNTGEEAEVEEGAELKDVTKEKGWPIAYGCEDGMCGTCIIKTAPEGGGLSPMEEKEKNTLSVMGMGDGEHRLACQCKVKGDCEIEGM
ncbi:MAG: 2Fe-2S iron-sulfur cluster binding domain-containing protein [Nitrospirae bacterium]|nr:2Fe-2S iron-sulfur cluster binding domain-containing protein [Nitrospirota bacterium]